MPTHRTRSEKLDLYRARKLKLTDEALADRRIIDLNAKQWKAFLTALDAPPCPLRRLARLFKERGVFDAGFNG